MKNLGKNLNKAEQKAVFGGLGGNNPFIDICGAGLRCNIWNNINCCPGLTCIDPSNTPFSNGICM